MGSLHKSHTELNHNMYLAMEYSYSFPKFLPISRSVIYIKSNILALLISEGDLAKSHSWSLSLPMYGADAEGHGLLFGSSP